jgi:hypothetical protein
MKDKLDYLISSLDMHLVYGKSPSDAWQATLKDYAYVYHSNDLADAPNPKLARAAKAALDCINEHLDAKETINDNTD